MSEKNKGGRPTKYKPEYCEMLISFFKCEPKAKTNEKGGYYVEGVLPTLERFASAIDVSTETLQEWKRKHEEFSVSLTRALELQKTYLIEGGLRASYNPRFTQFILSCNHGMHETSNQNINADVTARDISDLYESDADT